MKAPGRKKTDGSFYISATGTSILICCFRVFYSFLFYPIILAYGQVKIFQNSKLDKIKILQVEIGWRLFYKGMQIKWNYYIKIF